MAIPKLFEAVNTLTSDEWSSFGKYLLMFTREDSDNYRLYKLLNKKQESILNEGFAEKSRIKHFPKLSSKGYSNLMSKVFLWFEDWFAIEIFKENAYEKQLMLVKGYNQRGLYKQANRVAQKLESEIKNEKLLDINHNATLARIYESQYYSNNPIKNNNGNSVFKDYLNSYLASVNEQLLKCLIEIENKKRISYQDNSKSELIINQIIECTEGTALSEILALTKKALATKDIEVFKALKIHLESNTIDPSTNLFLVLSIYLRKCAASIWHSKYKGDLSVLVETYHLSFMAFDKNKHQKFLSSSLFNGVSAVGTILDFDQTKVFIDKWIDKVFTKNRSSTLKYCQALNAFRHDRYEEMPELLMSLEFDQPIFKFISSALIIISQYELGEEDLMMTLIQNYKKQLKRNQSIIPVSTFTRLNNLIDIVLLLNKSKYSKVEINLEDHQPYFFKSWVLKHVKK